MALPGVVTFNTSALDLLLYAPGGPVGKELRKRAVAVAAQAAINARERVGRNAQYASRTGRLAGNYKVEVEYPIAKSEGGFRFKVVNRTRGVGRRMSYAAAIEQGTKPHVIRAKPGKKLVFIVSGRKVVTNSVNWKPRGGSPMTAGVGYKILEDAVRQVWRQR